MSSATVSAQVIQAFARGRMLGEGDVLRALGASTYCLQYSQDPRLELHFRVESLATDLRSGVRLCRCIELLSGGHVHRLGFTVAASRQH